jgi:hypothetical protein
MDQPLGGKMDSGELEGRAGLQEAMPPTPLRREMPRVRLAGMPASGRPALRRKEKTKSPHKEASYG